MSPPSSRPQSVQQLQQQIAEARAVAARISLSMRMQVLKAFREGLVHQEEKILEANRADLEEAKNNASISPSLLKRLSLDGDKIKKLVSSIDAIIAAPNPIGKCTLATELTPGRPEAFIQIAALGIKSGNVCQQQQQQQQQQQEEQQQQQQQQQQAEDFRRNVQAEERYTHYQCIK
ncbi:gamma-glutamyl phosphate reductase, putative [Eimeria maxima]|uniref:Gamma-glutamyl phosphate reductase, putative n=1 Tax=Eimeria maxima TaxID=5804 RepID=U6LVI2_EIMMA|nr:gamma-glutamyl phosphate reductase, putative [Eimeria maxima]CDJ55962.1 gamma-glutamyl phosphate reductase, putative [Eimeria maxima]